MQPLHDKVLIERIENEKQTASGILLTRTDGPEYAKVLAIGPDVEQVAVDDVVLVDWNKATKYKEQYFIKEESIVFIYED